MTARVARINMPAVKSAVMEYVPVVGRGREIAAMLVYILRKLGDNSIMAGMYEDGVDRPFHFLARTQSGQFLDIFPYAGDGREGNIRTDSVDEKVYAQIIAELKEISGLDFFAHVDQLLASGALLDQAQEPVQQIAIGAGARIRTFFQDRHAIKTRRSFDIGLDEDGRTAAVSDLPWYVEDTHLEEVDAKLDLKSRIRALARDAGGRVVHILDWGCGQGVTIRDLKKWLEKENITNVKVYGFSDRYYSRWRLVKQGRFFLGTADQLLKLATEDDGSPIQFDLVFTHKGMHNHLELVAQHYRKDSVNEYLKGMSGIMRPGSVLLMDHWSAETGDYRRFGFEHVVRPRDDGGKYDHYRWVAGSPADQAMDPTLRGGIDLNPVDKALKVNDPDGGLAWSTDAAMLQRLERATGIRPVIVNVVPLNDLGRFMGAPVPSS